MLFMSFSVYLSPGIVFSNNPDDRCFQVGFGSQLRWGVDQVVQVVQVGNILNGYDSRQVELD